MSLPPGARQGPRFGQRKGKVHRVCRTCLGTGEVRVSPQPYEFGRRIDQVQYGPCAACQGTGNAPEDREP